MAVEVKKVTVSRAAAVPALVAIAVMIGLKLTVYPDAYAPVSSMLFAGLGTLVLTGLVRYVWTQHRDG
jgi:hypothetical protein